jgi:broad specificity phosphatase PhoE
MNEHEREAWNRYHEDFMEKVARAQEQNPLPPRDPAERIDELLARAERAEREAEEWQRVAIAAHKTAIEAHREMLAVTRPRCAVTEDMFEAGDAGC